MQPLNGRIAGDDNIGVVAEPLQAAIPDIAMDVIIDARGQPKKFSVPHRCQDEPNDENSPGNGPSKSGRDEKLPDREEIGDAGKRQPGHEMGSAAIAEVARAEGQGHAQRDAEYVHSLRGGGLQQYDYNSPWPVRERVRGFAGDCPATSSHSLSHAAVRGALAGARRNSWANRVRSSATSIS